MSKKTNSDLAMTSGFAAMTHRLRTFAARTNRFRVVGRFAAATQISWRWC
jgi:hypothetical protein